MVFIRSQILICLIALLTAFAGWNNLYAGDDKNMKHQNRLANEKSPYLLQHADNPVDWYPWGDEAFEKARKEDKPILLSIGYSTCHWCHVMEHESFEDEQVASLINEIFIPIKVDREERPDIDNVYMNVCHMLSEGNCGWPLNIMMTADKKPFFAATYIPKESRYGRAGIMQLLPKVDEMWKNSRDEVLESAEKITFALKQSSKSQTPESSQSLDVDILNRAFSQLDERFDTIHGGFGRAPKFPSPHNFLFLIRYWHRTGEEKALKITEQSLQKIRMGGIYDHIGGGFHRYSTDAVWLVPHFEKMLYDQAMLAMAYTEAFQVTGEDLYKSTAEEIFKYVLRDMTSPDGGFYSAEDADSEGVEGKYYLWTQEEIKTILGKEKGDLFSRIFNVSPEGNFKDEATGIQTNENILHLKSNLEDIAGKENKSTEYIAGFIEESAAKLFETREKRIHPYKDDKILVDWNGLMIAALAKASKAFNNTEYSGAAAKAVEFIMTELRMENGGLLHRYREGQASIKANIDDYSFIIWGLIELYEATFDTKYLKFAIELNSYAIGQFWDEDGWAFYFTPSDGEKLLVRQKEIYDGAIPSGNSVYLLNLLRLSKLTAEPELESKSFKITQAFYKYIDRYPSGFTQFLCGLDFGLGPSYELIIVGNKKESSEMLKTAQQFYFPRMVILFKDTSLQGIELEDYAEFIKSHKVLNEKPTAYVCKNYICNLPTNDMKKMLNYLEDKS